MKTRFLSRILLASVLSSVFLRIDHSLAEDTSAAPRTLPWSFLAPESGKPFSDPFARLTSVQLQDLSYVIQVRQLIADNRIERNGKDAKDAETLARKLKQQGIDIGWLMAQRERVRQIRGLQVESLSKSIASSLQQQRVSLIGYMIPIKVKKGRLTEFFLVPTIAACSHEDAPPRLQVVFVSSRQGVAFLDKRTPVRVTGKVSAVSTLKTMFNGNGIVKVHSAYAISSPEIELFQPSGNKGGPSESQIRITE